MSTGSISLRQLRYFVATVDAGSLTQAANILRIAQPAVSQQIADLEAVIGASLLIRSSRGVRATDIGDFVYAQAQSMLRQVAQLPTMAQASERELAGEVSLGLISTLAARLSVPLIALCRSRHPKIRLRILEGTSVTIREMVNSLRVDLGVVFESESAPGVIRRPLFDQRLFAIEAGDGPETTITLHELATRELVLASAPNTIRKALAQAFSAHELTPCLLAETTSFSSLIAAAASGTGTTVLPLGDDLSGFGAPSVRRLAIDPPIWLTASTILSALSPIGAAAHAVHELIAELAAERVSNKIWLGARPVSPKTA
jgi:LysR family nitrogen assimilation transcriptional regulator